MNLDLSSPKTIKGILTKYETAPRKRMGQNFLVNKRTLEKIIESAELKTEDTILEVGPGIGTLTQELARRVKKVIAVEKDRNMCQILKETLGGFRNMHVIQGDILKVSADLPEQYKLVANIPYYLTSPLIRKFLEIKHLPEFMVLMVQKEVAQRICARPPNMNILAVSVQFYAKAKIISYVKKENFWPKPKVDSAIIKITPRKIISAMSAELFFKIVKAGFSQPRKQLVNNLTTLKSLNGVELDKVKISEWLFKNNLKPGQRAETLDIKNWINLAQNF